MYLMAALVLYVLVCILLCRSLYSRTSILRTGVYLLLTLQPHSGIYFVMYGSTLYSHTDIVPAFILLFTIYSRSGTCMYIFMYPVQPHRYRTGIYFVIYPIQPLRYWYVNFRLCSTPYSRTASIIRTGNYLVIYSNAAPVSYLTVFIFVSFFRMDCWSNTFLAVSSPVSLPIPDI
jgi:hypothetical protein